MNFGFVIDNESCIGCHACSTACKSENEVPLGVQRTWVKSVEAGRYPDVRRSFQVTRCNHCSNPPCVRICPVSAMYQRGDGIVEFDADACIGCKACLQACPYDAIYIDPDTGTAAKCHYCAHRVDLGLEPACVVVCPEHAILAGDLDDPDTEIARAVAENRVTVRKPEQGTAPKLFYIGGEDTAMHPTAVERAPNSFAWADVVSLEGHDMHGPGRESHATESARTENGAAKNHGAATARAPAPHSARTSESRQKPRRQGVPEGGPIMIGEGRMAEQMTQVVYNAQHRVPWHWQVPAYLVTKAIGAGLFILLSAAYLLGRAPFDPGSFLTVGLASIFFTAATTALLVADLERPERFLRILTRGQWSSWLVRGAWLLLAFSLISGAWWVLEWASSNGWVERATAFSLRAPLMWPGLVLGAGAAVYTAFLFGQAEGRDLWQSPLLPIQLLIQAVMAGGAMLLVLHAVFGLSLELVSYARQAFGGAVAINLLVMMMGEFGMTPASEAAAKAARDITHGRFATSFWLGAVVAGHVVSFLLLVASSAPAVSAVAGLLSLVGLYLYERAFVAAPQLIPNS